MDMYPIVTDRQSMRLIKTLAGIYLSAVALQPVLARKPDPMDKLDSKDFGGKADDPWLYSQCSSYVKRYEAKQDSLPLTIKEDGDGGEGKEDGGDDETTAAATPTPTAGGDGDCDTFTAQPFTQLKDCLEIGAFGDRNGAYSREACKSQCVMNANCRAIQYGAEECPHQCKLFAYKVGEDSPLGKCSLVRDQIRQLWDVHELISRCPQSDQGVVTCQKEDMIQYTARIGSSFELTGCIQHGQSFFDGRNEEFSQQQCLAMCLAAPWCKTVLVEGRRCTGLSYEVSQLEDQTKLKCNGKSDLQIANQACRLQAPQRQRTVRSKLFRKICATAHGG